MAKADIGLIGLAVMGQNLVLNMANHGYTVAVYNRTTSKVDEFIKGPAVGKSVIGTHSLQELVSVLERPRKIMLMVKAGRAVDAVIQQLQEFLEPGDVIIDGGNSYFKDTVRRAKELEEKGIFYLGTGVSGGEEGALKGPSIMPGGSKKAWDLVGQILIDISAKVDGEPCCAYLGPDGAGHYVKMVHNGIEYGDMQLISEAYFLMKELLGLKAEEMAEVFSQWNRGELESYLIEVTADIFRKQDSETGMPLVELILDTAGQKGTGKWTSQEALDLGCPLTMITEAVFARFLSALKEERVKASKVLSGPKPAFDGNREEFLGHLRQALYAAKICSYAQGFALLADAAKEYGWDLDFGQIALLWRGGCIIRAQFLNKIKDAYMRDPKLANLLLDPYFKKAVEDGQGSWRKVVATAVENGVPVPGFSSALAYYDSYRRERLPANLIQAQRDYFGAHTYQRIDKEGIFHTQWK
ncbi:MAG: decarboxylating NADP(+)-dependent phosphogluconate dehydrogenase [Firmicutes bacterium]|nr:decarboxylating NADP(+)-dependent phosphogluconate dehydrogenase [Bacillota bacterium]